MTATTATTPSRAITISTVVDNAPTGMPKPASEKSTVNTSCEATAMPIVARIVASHARPPSSPSSSRRRCSNHTATRAKNHTERKTSPICASAWKTPLRSTMTCTPSVPSGTAAGLGAATVVLALITSAVAAMTAGLISGGPEATERSAASHDGYGTSGTVGLLESGGERASSWLHGRITSPAA